MIMATFQEEILKQFGHLRVCIDGTHGLNAYDLNLYTLVTFERVREWRFSCILYF